MGRLQLLAAISLLAFVPARVGATSCSPLNESAPAIVTQSCSLGSGDYHFRSLFIAEGAVVTVTVPARLVAIEAVVVEGTLAAGGNRAQLTVAAPAIRVSSTGTISANGAGFTSGTQDASCPSVGGRGGGVHGGGPQGSACGDYEWPVLAGSAGGAGTNAGGAGGGSLLLLCNATATSELDVNGTVSVNGVNGIGSTGYNYQASGGGSGGSLLVVASRLSGTGMLSANGGAGARGYSSYHSAPGSGGRVAMHVTGSGHAAFRGTVRAIAGAAYSTLPQAAAGTVFWCESPGSAPQDAETNRFGCGVRRVEVDNGDLAVSSQLAQLVASGSQQRFEVDELHLGPGVRFSVQAPTAFDAATMPDVRSSVLLGNVTARAATTRPVVHVPAGTTVTLAGLVDGSSSVGRTRTWSSLTVSPGEASWATEVLERTTVVGPLEVSAASLSVEEHGRAVLPPSVVVRGAALSVSGELVGVRSLTLDSGAVATFSSTGATWVNDTAEGMSGELWASWACGPAGSVSACASDGSSRASGSSRGRFGFSRLRLLGDATLTLGAGVTALGAAEVSVLDTSTLTLGSLASQQFRLTARDRMQVAVGASVVGDGAGFTSGTQDASCPSVGGRGGGVHGGGPQGSACGDYEWPVLAGSAGGAGTNAGGAGGGSLLLLCNATATSELDVNGTVSVNGVNGIGSTGYNYQANGGGSGGSLLVVASRLSGTGMLSANGGAGAQGYSSYHSAPGSGGRVAMHVTGSGHAAFRGTVRAVAGAAYSTLPQAAAGTVFWCESPGSAPQDAETNRFGCGVRRVEVDNGDLAVSSQLAQLVASGSQQRFEVDELHLGPGVRFSVQAPTAFDAATMPDVRSSVLLGNVTARAATTRPVVHVPAGTTVTLAGLVDGSSSVGRTRTWSSLTVSPGEASWATEVLERTTVVGPLEVSAASLSVEEHGRAVLPPSVVVRGAALSVSGELVGVRSLTLDSGAVATFSSTGATWVNDTAEGMSGELWASWACGPAGSVSACASDGSSRASGSSRGRFGFSRLRLLGDATLTLGAGVTALGAAEVSVLDTSTLTLGSLASQQFRLTARDRMQVAVGASVVGDGAGFTSGTQDASCPSVGGRGGGVHGGGPQGSACGDYEWPVLAGSAGGAGTNAGGAGGGSLLLLCNATATSELDVNGTVSVNGVNGIGSTGYNYQANGGGSGGSLLVVASRLSGTGMLSANGGAGAQGYSSYHSAPGSGGRVAMHVTGSGHAAFRGTARAVAGAAYSTLPQAAAGTVFWCESPGSAPQDAETNRFGCGVRRVEVDNGDLAVSSQLAQLVASGSQQRFEVDELHLGPGVRFSVQAPTAFDAATMPDVRSSVLLGNVTARAATTRPVVHVPAGTTVTLAGLVDGSSSVGRTRTWSSLTVSPGEASWATEVLERTTVVGPLEVSAASLSVEEHGRAVLPPSVVVRGAALSVSGELVGVRSLTLDSGAVATFSSTGATWVNDTAEGMSGELWASWACGPAGSVSACASDGSSRASGSSRGRFGFSRLRLLGDATLTLGAGVTALGAAEVSVLDTSTLTLGSLASQQFRLTARDRMQVAVGASVVGDGAGFTSGTQDASCPSVGGRGGGVHGGGPQGSACGDYEWPVLAGSAGGAGTNAGGAGGGSLLLLCNATATSELDVNGTVSVNGVNGIGSTGYNYQANGGGSGGSLLVVASRLSGTGMLSANGGAGAQGYSSYHSAPGSGGRVAMHVTGSGHAAFRGTARAVAGAAYSTLPQAAAGTVFWCESPGSAPQDAETNRFGCGVRRVEVDNGDLAVSSQLAQLVASGSQQRFEVDELHLGPGVRFSVQAPTAFDAATMPDVRSSVLLGNVTARAATTRPVVHVPAGTTVTLAGLVDGSSSVGRTRTWSSLTVSPGEASWATEVLERTTVVGPLEVSAASLSVEEHGRAVLPPSVVVRGAALSVSGELVGVRSLTLDSGAVATFSSTGATWVNDTAEGMSGELWASWACGPAGSVSACASDGSSRASGSSRGRFGFSRLRLLGDATLTLGAGVTALGAAEVSVLDTSTLTLGSLASQQFRLTARDRMQVAVGASVVGDGAGFTSGTQDASCPSVGGRGGGVHGGGPQGSACGDYEWPVLAGSAGGAGTNAGGAGGGSLLLLCNATATSELDVNGTVSVNGVNGIGSTGYNYQANGGGSGGSLLVVASRLSGTGMLSANGGAGAQGYSSYHSAPGSGGRVAMHVTGSGHAAFRGTVRAIAGAAYSTLPQAAAGTLAQLVASGSQQRFEVDELHLGPGVRFSVQAPTAFDAATMPDVRSAVLLGNVTARAATTRPVVHVPAGTTVTLAGLVDGSSSVGRTRTWSSLTVSPGEASWATEVLERTTVVGPLEVSAASLSVEEHGRAVLPPSVVVRGAALSVSGELVGVRSLTLDSGAVATFSSTGATWVNDTAEGMSGELWASWACGPAGSVSACASDGSSRASGSSRGRFGFSRLRLLGDATLTLGAGVTALGAAEVSVLDTSTLTLGSLASQQFRLTARDRMQVAVGASVVGDGAGFTSGTQDASCPSVGGRGGGVHGGGPQGSACGDYEWPVLAGSAGGAGTNAGGAGGGSLLLLCNATATSELDVNGTVSVNGVNGIGSTGYNYQANGGGSGGSLLVVASRLSGTGMLSANGGAGARGYSSYHSAPGSGGRVAIHAISLAWHGQALACQGSPFASYYAAPGTVFHCTGADCSTTLGRRSNSSTIADGSTRKVVVDACGIASSGFAALGAGLVPVKEVNSVVLVRGGAASLVASRDVAKVPSTQLRVESIAGDNSGTLAVASGTSLVVLGTGSGWAPGKGETVVRYTDAGERTLYTVQRVLTGQAELFFADMSLAAGGKLYLPAVVSICNVSLSFAGTVYGADTLKICQNALTSASLSITGCKDPEANNFNLGAVHGDNSTCYYGGVRGCTYAVASNFDPLAEVNDGSCVLTSGLKNGCPYSAATNYLASSLDDGTCEFPDFGALVGQVRELEAQILPLQSRLNSSESQLSVVRESRAAEEAKLQSIIAQLSGNVTDLQTLVSFFNRSCGPGSFDVARDLAVAEAKLVLLRGNVSELQAKLNDTTLRAQVAEGEVQASDAKNALLLSDLATPCSNRIARMWQKRTPSRRP
ncbi:hypothetical protein FNF29_07150 [Cafeteria roenbergensis]|uniref:Uncharacterized protein n=1 Tax=Cafeteria roenbergensis TaxID=33653 RepID=A0A5A8C417_CAFRO|nr:hypothetical protein FNF29_07150 [Cafeteria roenbergensis]|eukprot:KAA0147806.1 hypothetical protein FNF29_07150 [Cafeteria roenbergensis]